MQPAFLRSQLQEHVRCLSAFFNVRVIHGPCDYKKICEDYEPDLTLFESGVYGGPRDVTNTSAFPDVPKLGFLNGDAFCFTRSVFVSDMERWGIDTFFTISVSMAEYFPDIADRLFVWPNFVDPDIFQDYNRNKSVPVLFIGSQKSHYPWRVPVNEALIDHFPSLTYPHFGWSGEKTSRTIFAERYAKLINASLVVPTCGSIAKEVVRKHFEIPGCNSCLITEETPALQAAGFVDMQNCVFATKADVVDKVRYLFQHRDLLSAITKAGHELVHSRHTLRNRDQILQWFTLFKSLQRNQRIIQPDPFAPLAIADERSRLTSSYSMCNGVDRALLRKATEYLQHGNYVEAELNYIKCLNFWPEMPEPTLGLTLCDLYKGDARKAQERIEALIRLAIARYKTPEPDPVEWSYFIIALLCQGNVAEATRRANQFPLLYHRELDRCRFVIDALRGSECGTHDPGEKELGARTRPSVHQLPDRDVTDWIRELCTMLRACQQHNLGEGLWKMICQKPVQMPLPSRPRDANPRSGSSVKGSRVVPLPTSEPLALRYFRRMPRPVRRIIRPLIATLRLLAGSTPQNQIEVGSVPEDTAAMSLIICTRNRCEQLARCLQSVGDIRFEQRWELIIVDNGSVDETATVVQEFINVAPAPVTYIFEPKKGKSNGLNTAISIARGKIIAFTDDDCYPAPDFLSQILVAFDDPAVGYISGRIMLHDATDYPITINESTEPRAFPAGSFVRAGAIQGANMAFRREVLVALGGFDPLFGPGSFFVAEDADVAGRASALGWSGEYCPEVVVRHHHGRKRSDVPRVLRSYQIGRGAYHMKLLLNERRFLWFARSIYELWRVRIRWEPEAPVWELIGAVKYTYRYLGEL